MLKIVLTGPESTGKTTLARQLAEHYQTVWVPEYARTYLSGLGRSYREEDLLTIAREQIRLEEHFMAKANRLLFCDTAMLVIKIWSEFKFGKCHPWIVEQLAGRAYHFYLLCGTDIPWEFDPLRENPGEREQLFSFYRRELDRLGTHYSELTGDRTARYQKAVRSINLLLENPVRKN